MTQFWLEQYGIHFFIFIFINELSNISSPATEYFFDFFDEEKHYFILLLVNAIFFIGTTLIAITATMLLAYNYHTSETFRITILSKSEDIA